MKQSKKNRSDNGESRHAWAYYSLEQKLDYKLALKGLKLIKRPAAYTSKSCSTCGTLGNRKGHHFNCPNGHYHNADLNAARNLAQWDGFSCPLNLERDAVVIAVSGLEDGVLGTPLNADVGFLSLREESVDARICVDLWRRVSMIIYDLPNTIHRKSHGSVSTPSIHCGVETRQAQIYPSSKYVIIGKNQN
jgi:hypothetical protein